jgi:hypothetical protein
MSVLLMAASPGGFTEEDVYNATLELHKSDDGKYLMWHECGEKLDSETREKRASEYAKAIMKSVEAVEARTGEWIDPRHVKAILYRESSDNECAVGKQEVEWLSQKLGKVPRKKKLIGYIQRWVRAKKESRNWCRVNKSKSIFRVDCAERYMRKHYPEYRSAIKGWDIGAAQFRYSSRIRNRTVELPSGRIIDKVGLEDLFNYEVSIQMLVEDLAVHKSICKNHQHVIRNKRGFIIKKLSTEEAYFAHHHTGSYQWSEKYWKRVSRHLNVINKVKPIALARLFSRFYWNNSFLI